MSGDPVKVAKFTVSDADIGRVQIAVNDPCHLIRAVFTDLPKFVCNKNQISTRCVFKKKNTLFNAEKFRLEGTV